MIDELQPQAVIFSDGGPGCRWVGNEKGFAGATNWSSSVPEKFIPVIPTIANCNTAMLTVINGWQPSVTFLSVRVGSIIRKKTAV